MKIETLEIKGNDVIINGKKVTPNEIPEAMQALQEMIN